MRADEGVRQAAELSPSSYGVVSAAELRRAHVDRKTVARLVARGDWTQLWRGMDATDGQLP